MTMIREQFMLLMGLTEDDEAMEYADTEVEAGRTYFEVAQEIIATLDYLVRSDCGRVC